MMISDTFKLLRQGKEKVIKKKITKKKRSLVVLACVHKTKNNHLENDGHIQGIRGNNVVQSTTS